MIGTNNLEGRFSNVSNERTIKYSQQKRGISVASLKRNT